MEITLNKDELRYIREGLEMLDGRPIKINNHLSMMYNFDQENFCYSFFIGMDCVDELIHGIVFNYVNSLVEAIFSPNKPRISSLSSFGRSVNFK
ncbi:MAG: hypothetical protein PWQ06_2785 [Anaerophaga sp.]|nr:hypothetical protein [Anaerophaga sp.]